MGVPSSSLQRELHDLSEVGILKTHRQGRMVYYQANTDSPVFPDLRGLLLKTAGLVDVLAQALKPVAAKVQTAFVYGSIAAGNEQSDSDIDLMVVGQVSPAESPCPCAARGNRWAARLIRPSTRPRNSARSARRTTISDAGIGQAQALCDRQQG